MNPTPYRRWFRLATPVALLILLALAGPALTRAQETAEQRLDPKELRTLRDQLASDSEFDPALRDAALAIYDEALVALEAAATDRSAAAGFRQEKAGVAGLQANLNAELDRPGRPPRIPLSDSATLEQAEAALARERAHLTANRNELRRAEGKAEERSSRRNEIAALLGFLDQQIVALDDQLRSGQLGQTRAELGEAARLRQVARREAMTAHLEKLRAEMELLEARGGIIPLELDLAQRRVTFGEVLVPMVEDRTRQLRRREAQASLQKVRDQVAEVMLLAPVLAEVAAETVALAEDVWGTEGTTARSADITRQLAATRKYKADLDRIAELARRRFAAFGYTGSLQRWWPELPEDFPQPGDIARALARLDQTLPEVQHQLIALEQERTASRAMETKVMADLTALHGGDESAAALIVARRLLDQRRDLLDARIRVQGRYAERLVELKTMGGFFLEDSKSIERFLYERLLWSRSVPQPIWPQPGKVWNGLLWVGSWDNWGGGLVFIYHRALAHPSRLVGMLLAFGILLGLRRRIRRRVTRLGGKVEDGRKDTLGSTLEVVVHTFLLAAPLPLALFLAHTVFLHASDSAFLFSAARAFYYLTSVAALMELGRQVLMPRGLGECHFGWPARITRRLYKQLVWPEAVFLFLMQVALHLGMAGIRLSSPQALQDHNNSLGRVAFMLAMSVLGLWLLAIFRGRGAPGADTPGGRSPVWDRLYIYAYPAIVLATLVPFLLAAAGYYITAILLAYQILRTLWLALVLLLVGGVLFRWCRLGCQQRIEDGKQSSPDVVDAQARSMFRFALVLAMAVGLYIVWADALPTLRMLKRVQIWPSITMLQETEQILPMAHSGSRAATTEGDAPAAAEGESAPVARIPGMPAPAATAESTSASSPLTLWSLLEAILVIIITVQVVKNVPGLLELTLQRRSLMDSGARIAIGTLVRYAAIIIGVSAAFSLLGISWSRIQWLAAALTFGLGFGLQEIVANFVSGLILLTERPVRVGDAVTIGNLQGRVERIQIRATTVALWDRSEMIVPNKEFITTKLINWTLTDSRRRIDLPVRVAYGSDLALVKKTLLDVAQGNANVLAEPPSKALLLDFGEDALKLELRCFVDFGMGLTVRDELHMAIDRAFRQCGIDFALPRLHLQMQRRTAPGAVPPGRPAEPSEP